MSKLTIDIPKGGTKPKFIDHGNDLLPNYLRPTKGSCHDKCKYGCRRLSESGSSWPSPWIANLQVDSISRRTSQAKTPSQINPRPWRIAGSSCSTDQPPRRRFSESLKKQNTVGKGKSKKCIQEHVPQKILHVVEPKAEGERNKATQGSFEKEVINETSDSDNSPIMQKVGNSTRRLSFSQHMSLLENENCNADDDTKESLRDTEPESRVNGPRKCIVIELKHQTVEVKQGFRKWPYNSLIEDTTHSRVKVKALVNAFETVISVNKSQLTTIPAIKGSSSSVAPYRYIKT